MSQAILTSSSAEHATIESLSAYLDQELSGDDARDLEAHLTNCDTCHRRLEGLRRTTSGLKDLHRIEPPADLQLTVARRIALDGKATHWLDRLEHLFSGFHRQSSVFVLLAVVLALSSIVVIFSQAVHRWQNQPEMIPVILNSESPDGHVLYYHEIANRRLFKTQEGWIEEEVDPNAVTRVLTRESPEAAEFFATHEALSDLQTLPGRVIFTVEEQVIELSATP